MPANFVLLLAIGLALVSSSAGAQAPCDAAALNGRYVFTGRGFIEAVQPGIQRMHYGVFVFDGAGKLTGKQSSSRGGKIGRSDELGFIRYGGQEAWPHHPHGRGQYGRAQF
jgi:hypothetical protein